MTSEELISFAEKYGFEVKREFRVVKNVAYFRLPSGAEIFEQMCIVKSDVLVAGVEPDAIVYAHGAGSG